MRGWKRLQHRFVSLKTRMKGLEEDGEYGENRQMETAEERGKRRGNFAATGDEVENSLEGTVWVPAVSSSLPVDVSPRQGEEITRNWCPARRGPVDTSEDQWLRWASTRTLGVEKVISDPRPRQKFQLFNEF